MALKKELMLRAGELPMSEISSLYFGGGTPSILTIAEIQQLIDEVLKYYDFKPDIEITLEANPDDLSPEYLKALAHTEVNRLSIGTQSFFDADLKLMNRAHNASQAEASIKRAQDTGFENISVDLIYGSPTSDMVIWRKNLEMAIALQVPHISSYALTVEAKTALQSWIAKAQVPAPKEDFQNEAFHYLSERLKAAGFIHYEISNFAQPDFYSKHNTAYWQYQPYLGIGPSAHSYNGAEQRAWNVANNSLYLKSLAENQRPLETEILSEYEQFNERLMIGLRTIWGVDMKALRQFLMIENAEFQRNLNEKLSAGILEIKDDRLIIPERHWFMADGIAADLFVLP